MDKPPKIYITADVEADGPIPGPYSMISLGLAAEGRPDLTFYTEICPISDSFDREALAASGLDRDRLSREAPKAEEAMQAAARWVNGLRKTPSGVSGCLGGLERHVVYWYFLRFTGKSPFGQTGSGVDLRSYGWV